MSVSARTLSAVAVSGAIASQPSGVLDHNGTPWTPTRTPADAPAARDRDARRGGRCADLRGHARCGPALALRGRGRRARAGSAGRRVREPRRALSPRSPPRARSASVPRHRGYTRAACAGPRVRARTSCRSTRPRPACWPGSRSPVSGPVLSSPRMAGRSRGAPAPRAPCTPASEQALRPSPMRSSASRATTCSSRASAASRRAAACT